LNFGDLVIDDDDDEEGNINNNNNNILAIRRNCKAVVTAETING